MAIDLVFVLLAGYGFYQGYYRGIIQTVFSVISIVVGLLVALKLSATTTRLLESAFENRHPMMFPAGFALTFLITLLLFRLLAKGFEGIIQTSHLNTLNRVGGGILLGGTITLIFSTLLWFGDQAGLMSNRIKNESQTYYPFLEAFPSKARHVATLGRPIFIDFWDKSAQTLDRMKQINAAKTTPSNHSGSYNLYDQRQTTRQKNSAPR